MVDYFQYIALNGWQFDRFEDAWCKWLEANSLIDWTEENLQERVETILLTIWRLDLLRRDLKRSDMQNCNDNFDKLRHEFYQQMATAIKAARPCRILLLLSRMWN